MDHGKILGTTQKVQTNIYMLIADLHAQIKSGMDLGFAEGGANLSFISEIGGL